jgi:hypothetical protein
LFQNRPDHGKWDDDIVATLGITSYLIGIKKDANATLNENESFEISILRASTRQNPIVLSSLQLLNTLAGIVKATRFVPV